MSDDARKLAKQVLFDKCGWRMPNHEVENLAIDAMLAFAAAERKAERERCAKVCRARVIDKPTSDMMIAMNAEDEWCAQAIERTP